MSRIDGGAGRSWPPLRISYAGEPDRDERAEAGVALSAPNEREQNLAALLEQRLSGKLTEIRASVSPVRTATYADPRGGSQPPGADAGSRLDILA